MLGEPTLGSVINSTPEMSARERYERMLDEDRALLRFAQAFGDLRGQLSLKKDIAWLKKLLASLKEAWCCC